MKKIIFACMLLLLASMNARGACPRADINGDCKVNLEDFAIMASEWMTEGSPILNGMTWVYINDDGAGMVDYDGNPISHSGFIGEMSKYETTNAQYCEYLNAALASGDVYVDGNYVMFDVDVISQVYYDLEGLGFNQDGADYGGAARMNWTGSSFTVDSGFEDHPVTYVSWYGATAFAAYYGWRLPTEWEWQAVADYDGSYTYAHGPGTITNTLANYYGSSHPNGTTAVGTYVSIHGYGISDMAGNAWEWTSSRWDVTNKCVLRGGGWGYFIWGCHVADRSKLIPDDMSSVPYLIGFRVCR